MKWTSGLNLNVAALNLLLFTLLLVLRTTPLERGYRGTILTWTTSSVRSRMTSSCSGSWCPCWPTGSKLPFDVFVCDRSDSGQECSVKSEPERLHRFMWGLEYHTCLVFKWLGLFSSSLIHSKPKPSLALTILFNKTIQWGSE